jgi:putative transposase
MARPLRIEYPGAFYHVTSRGNERKKIFSTDSDRKAFLSYLASSVERYGAVVHTYCLMSNHFHLLLETPEGNLSRIMQHINGAYTTHYNVKKKRSGHLFQGRFHAVLVDADSYAMELSRYIHLNPVRAGIVSTPEEYPWSSYRSYTGKEKAPDFLTTSFVLGYFDASTSKAHRSYARFVEEIIGTEYENPFVETVASTILGGKEFIEKVSGLLEHPEQSHRDIPALSRISRRPTHEAIAKTVETLIPDDKPLARKIAIHLTRKLTGTKLKAIGEIYGMTDASVAQTCKRLLDAIAQDKQLKRIVEKAEKMVALSYVEI